MIHGVEGVDPARRQQLIDLLDIDLQWRLNRISDGQRRRVQICMGLLKPYKVSITAVSGHDPADCCGWIYQKQHPICYCRGKTTPEVLYKAVIQISCNCQSWWVCAPLVAAANRKFKHTLQRSRHISYVGNVTMDSLHGVMTDFTYMGFRCAWARLFV